MKIDCIWMIPDNRKLIIIYNYSFFFKFETENKKIEQLKFRISALWLSPWYLSTTNITVSERKFDVVINDFVSIFPSELHKLFFKQQLTKKEEIKIKCYKTCIIVYYIYYLFLCTFLCYFFLIYMFLIFF